MYYTIKIQELWHQKMLLVADFTLKISPQVKSFSSQLCGFTTVCPEQKTALLGQLWLIGNRGVVCQSEVNDTNLASSINILKCPWCLLHLEDDEQKQCIGCIDKEAMYECAHVNGWEWIVEYSTLSVVQMQSTYLPPTQWYLRWVKWSSFNICICLLLHIWLTGNTTLHTTELLTDDHHPLKPLKHHFWASSPRLATLTKHRSKFKIADKNQTYSHVICIILILIFLWLLRELKWNASSDQLKNYCKYMLWFLKMILFKKGSTQPQRGDSSHFLCSSSWLDYGEFHLLQRTWNTRMSTRMLET